MSIPPSRQPVRVHLELTSVCNFACDFCPQVDLARPKRGMEWGLLTKILQELAQSRQADFLTFHVMGEPMLYPRFFEAVDVTLALGLALHLTTNGSTLALQPSHSSQLIQRPIPKVILSLQTPETESFKVRGAPPGLTAERYFQGISDYLRAHLASTSPTKVHLKFMDTSPHPLLVPYQPLHILDNREHLIDQMTHWLDPLGLQADFSRLKVGRWNVIPVTERLFLESFPLDNWGNQRIPARWGYCNGAQDQIAVLQDGRVVPCCKDYEGVITLGNLRDQTLAEVLQGSVACDLRAGFDQLQVRQVHCQRCMGADTRTKALLRSVASVAYFKIYKPLHPQLDP